MSYAEKYAQARKVIDTVNAGPGRRLGGIQEGVLKALITHGGYPGGWVWDTRKHTEKVLDSLVKRGLVERTDHPMTDYRGQRFPEGHPYHTATTASYAPSATVREILAPTAVL